MTKDKYFEMCEMMGSEPVDSEIPVEIEDFPELVIQCFLIYRILPDIWDTMNGNYLGKDYSLIFSLFKLYSLDESEHLLSIGFLQEMDTCRGKVIAEKLKAKMDKKP
jgi:hypothetical protein